MRGCMFRKALSFPIYPFLYPVYLVLYLFSQNVEEVEFSVVVRPVIILCIITAILFVIIYFFIKEIHKTAILCFCLLVSFFSYGYAYQYLKDHPVLSVSFGHHILLGTLWIAITLAVIIGIISKKLQFNKKSSMFFTLILLGLLVMPVSVTIHGINTYSQPITTDEEIHSLERKSQEDWLAKEMQSVNISQELSLPDIYYIVPDMFARSDAILNETGYDNSSFLQALEEKGFYIASCSRSNYASTQLSLTSAFNFNYLDQIQNGFTDRSELVVPMRNSLLRATLESQGYTIITFDNGFGLPEIPDADIIIEPEKPPLFLQAFNPFENLIIRGSFLRVLYDVDLGLISDLYDRIFFPYHAHVSAQKYILDQLPQLNTVEGPKFIYAHLMIPHPPYLFREDGSIETDSRFYREALGQPVNEELYLEGYRRQVIFLEQPLLDVVDQILQNSEVEPIIIIQGDHGIRDENRLDILNAIYVPKNLQVNFYPSITPVNTFRVVLNGLFNTRYELLPDSSFYSVYPEWFDMKLENEHNINCAP